MNINIREDQMQHAELFGKSVLYAGGRIPRDAVLEGWYCYDMRGLEKTPGEPATLEDQVGVNYSTLTRIWKAMWIFRAMGSGGYRRKTACS